MAHGQLGLSEIQRLAGIGELFDTLLVFENYPVDHAGLAREAAGLRLGRVGGHDATHYPLSLLVRPGEELQLRLDYRPDLFDRGSVVALGDRLLRLLAGAVAAPDRSLGLLDVLSDAERTTILSEWNATARPVAAATLPELFAAQAARSPDAVAVICGERRLCYAELEAHANQLAHHLRGLGVGPETVVGLCVERSPEMVIGLLGILKAGGSLPAARSVVPGGAAVVHAFGRRRRRAGDAGGACHAAAGAAPARRCGSTPTGPNWRASRPHAPPAAPDPGHPAYVIYTSGSTGTPKGVVVTHGGVEQLPGRDAASRCRSRPPTGCWRSPPSASTSRRSSSTCRSCGGARSCWRRARRCRTPRRLARTIDRDRRHRACRPPRRCGSRWCRRAPTRSHEPRRSHRAGRRRGAERRACRDAAPAESAGRQSLWPDRDHDLVGRHGG